MHECMHVCMYMYMHVCVYNCLTSANRPLHSSATIQKTLPPKKIKKPFRAVKAGLASEGQRPYMRPAVSLNSELKSRYNSESSP